MTAKEAKSITKNKGTSYSYDDAIELIKYGANIGEYGVKTSIPFKEGVLRKLQEHGYKIFGNLYEKGVLISWE